MKSLKDFMVGCSQSRYCKRFHRSSYSQVGGVGSELECFHPFENLAIGMLTAVGLLGAEWAGSSGQNYLET